MAGRAGLADRSALKRLTAIPAARFAEEYWTNAPLLTRHDELAGGFGDLFSVAAADEILSTRGLRTPFIRVAKDGAIVDNARFTGPGGVGASVGDQVLDERILELFAAGNTVVLQGLHRFWPPLIHFAGDLAADLGHPVQINAYITPRQSRGFSAHYDVHDVFVLQIAGTKRWILHDPVYEDPLTDQPWTQRRAAVESRANEQPLQEAVLEGGDVLYLPRGFIHSAQALGGVSVHLTIGVHGYARSDLVRALLEIATDDPRLRRTLPMGIDIRDGDDLEPDLAATIEALTERLRSVTTAEVASVMERRARTSTRPAPLGPLAQAQALDALGPDTVIRVRARQQTTLTSGQDGVTVRHSGGTLSFPCSHSDALHRVLQSPAGIRVGDLSGLGEAESCELARQLMRAGIVLVDTAAFA